MKYSAIVATFGRPDEVRELLDSLCEQQYKNFEVLMVDGTPDEELVPVIGNYKEKLDVKHIHRPYLGISDSRNLGCEKAEGDYFIIFDSDCIIPPHYFQTIHEKILKENIDAFGGPDAALSSFTPLQKAINYSMTSFFTTGGIRGKKKRVGQFHPRGFNMGFSKAVFDKTKGFSSLKVSED
ncbi:MAG: glycosyltransferase family 2 protein, partial [Flavobacteriales bacterium]